MAAFSWFFHKFVMSCICKDQFDYFWMILVCLTMGRAFWHLWIWYKGRDFNIAEIILFWSCFQILLIFQCLQLQGPIWWFLIDGDMAQSGQGSLTSLIMIEWKTCFILIFGIFHILFINFTDFNFFQRKRPIWILLSDAEMSYFGWGFGNLQ